MNFVILGSPKCLSIKEMTALIYGISGNVQGEVSKRTDYLIVSEGDQSKYNAMKRSEAYLYVNLLQAKKHKIKVIDETEFLEMMVSELLAKVDLLPKN